MNLTMIYIGIWTYIKEEVENVVVESWRRYILYPPHAAGLSQHVSPTSMWGFTCCEISSLYTTGTSYHLCGLCAGTDPGFQDRGPRDKWKKKKKQNKTSI